MVIRDATSGTDWGGEIALARGGKDTLGQRLDDTTAQLASIDQDRGFNIRWNEHLVVDDDWTLAIQNALDNHKHVYIPRGTFKHTGLTVKLENAKITGNAQLYTESILEYQGTGTAITVATTVGYFSLENIKIIGVPSVSTDFFNTGSVGIDVTQGATSTKAYKLWLQGFETLVKSDNNSFYNNFTACRFERALNCLFNFADYNFEVRGSRFLSFHNAIVASGPSGPMTIHKNSFEVFNGYILQRTGTAEGVVNFTDNYIEIYDTVDLPTNFPNPTANGAITGKFGGNTLFTGAYRTLNIEGNSMLIQSVFRIVNASSCKQFRSTNNLIHLYETGNNLNVMYSIPNAETYYIKDQCKKGGEGMYNRTYVENKIPLPNPHNEGYFYDCVLDKELVSNDKIYSPTLENGWKQGDANYGYPRMFITQDGLHLQGYLDGSTKTGNTVFTIPEKYRPFTLNTRKGYANLSCFTSNGEFVRFRYTYSTGEFALNNTPTDLVDINLDGLTVPIRI